MGRNRLVMVVLAMLMVLGIVAYLKLWSMDYGYSSDDREILRKQFDLANREAMDESAEWRYKYDEEVERGNTCLKELREVQDSLKNKSDAAVSNKEKIEMLEKENAGLLERVESLTQDLEREKLSCSLLE